MPLARVVPDARGVILSASHVGITMAPWASVLPFGLYANDETVLVCPFSMAVSLAVATSPSLTVLSNDPVAKHFPSGLNATE